jgi:hypothetical protein
MKKLFALIMLVAFVGISSKLTAQDTLVYFKFKVNLDSSNTGGNSFNLEDLMLRDTSFHGKFAYSAGVDGNPPADYSLSSVNWINGMDAKFYYTSFSTSAHQNITFSSVQRSSGTGPRDFKVQYKVGSAGTWADVTGATVLVGNDFTTGVLTSIALPSDCNNQPEVFLRWIMTSNTSVGAGTVAAAGTSRVDNIFVYGDVITGISQNASVNNIRFYPNPTTDIFHVNNLAGDNITVEVYSTLGSKVLTQVSEEKDIVVDMRTQAKGLYYVQIVNNVSQNKTTGKLVVK